jgi:hypothetical protein
MNLLTTRYAENLTGVLPPSGDPVEALMNQQVAERATITPPKVRGQDVKEFDRGLVRRSWRVPAETLVAALERVAHNGCPVCQN